MDRRFQDRREAGQVLAEDLGEFRDRSDVIVIALPRGGVPVGHEVARRLGAPLDVLMVRKLGFPGHEEFAIGAIASGGFRVMNRRMAENLSQEEVEKVAVRERAELQRRAESYRGDRPPPDLAGKAVILVDDGVATGSTMRVAAAAIKEQGPAELVLAVPVGPPETITAINGEIDRVVCPSMPAGFQAVSQWYEDFSETTDEEVRQLLLDAREARS